MATYKVIQDIEAEDHILGPLSLKQFIFALIAVGCFYLSFIGIAKHVWPLAVIFVPPGLILAFFAFPWGKDQPTEVWALAKIRFLLKPRRRIWDQSGIKELVTITVPKKIEHVYSDGLSQTEVKSRLHALADTIDSRGWAVKNVNVNLSAQPNALIADQSSDRLIDVSALPQQVSNADVQASDDILDADSNPIAQQFDRMITTSSRNHRQQIIQRLNGAGDTAPQAPPADYWFLHQAAPAGGAGPNDVIFANPQVVAPGTDTTIIKKGATAEEKAIAKKLRENSDASQASYAHMRTFQPHDAETTSQADRRQAPSQATMPIVATKQSSAQTAPAPATPTPNPAILELAGNNDLNVATLARQANKALEPEQPDEVVISLH
jgi:hypothetical protein